MCICVSGAIVSNHGPWVCVCICLCLWCVSLPLGLYMYLCSLCAVSVSETPCLCPLPKGPQACVSVTRDRTEQLQYGPSVLLNYSVLSSNSWKTQATGFQSICTGSGELLKKHWCPNSTRRDYNCHLLLCSGVQIWDLCEAPGQF